MLCVNVLSSCYSACTSINAVFYRFHDIQSAYIPLLMCNGRVPEEDVKNKTRWLP